MRFRDALATIGRWLVQPWPDRRTLGKDYILVKLCDRDGRELAPRSDWLSDGAEPGVIGLAAGAVSFNLYFADHAAPVNLPLPLAIPAGLLQCSQCGRVPVAGNEFESCARHDTDGRVCRGIFIEPRG